MVDYDFSAFEKPSQAAESPKLDFSAFELPQLPEDPSLLDPSDAETIIKKYQDAGKDPGIEIIYGFGAENTRSKSVRRKSYMSAYKAPELSDDQAEAQRKDLKERMDASYAKEVQSRTNIFEQFGEGLLRPTEELALGALELTTGEKQPETYMKTAQVRYDQLSAPQKVSYVLGAAAGYASPGGVINAGVKGLLKVGVSPLGKMKLIEEASQAVMPAVKGLQKLGEEGLKKLPSESLRGIVAEYSSLFFKNAASLSLEGAAWGTLESRGDLEKTIENAVVFPLAGTAMMVAAPRLIEGGKKVIEAGSENISRGMGKLLSKSTPEGAEIAIQPSVDAAMVKRSAPKETGFERAEHVKNRDLAEKVWASKHDPNEILLKTQEELPKGIQTDEYLRLKKMETARISAVHEVQTQVEKAKLFGKWQSEKGKADALSQQLGKLREQRRKLVDGIAKSKSLKVEEVYPKTIDDLRLSYNGKELLEESYGTLERMPKHSDVREMIETLHDEGLSITQASSVAKQVMLPELVTKKLTPYKAERVGVSSERLRRIEGAISKIERQRDQYLIRAREVRKAPQFTEDVNPDLIKLDAKAVGELAGSVYRDKLEKQGLRMGIQEFKEAFSSFPTLRKIMNWSERDNYIEMQTGVPVFQLRQEMIEGVNIRSHLTKAVADAYQPDQVYKQLRNIGANGEELSLWMRYVRSTKDGVKWDPSAVEIGPYKIPAFDPKSMGPEPAQEVKELLFKSRQMLDHVHEMQRSAGVDIGYLPGYVPIKKAYLESLGTGRVKRNKLNEPSFLQRRKRGEVSEEEAKRYELDFYNWMPSSVRGGIKSAAFPNMAEKVNAAYWHFKNAGRGQYADEFLKQVSTALGHKGSTETIEFIASEVAKQNSQWIGAATKIYEAHGKMPLGEDLHLGIQNVMYNLAIGLNPKTMLQQFMQPEWVGAAEIGLKWTEKGKALAFGGKLFSKESRAALERVKSRLYPEELDVALMGEPKGERRKSIELISQAMGMPGWPGMKLFAALDKKNRELMYLGAIEKWKWATKNGKLKETMEHLLEGEKSQILKAWERSGEQEAMDRFGLIVSKRSNYAYNLVEKGEFFQQGIGAKIPFVNFGVNQWMRHIEASRHFLKTKDPMPLAKLIAYGVGGAVAFQELTGQKFFPTKIPVPGGSLEMSSAIPQAAMFGMGTLSPLTAYTSVVGGRLFTPTRVKDQYERYLGKGKKEKKQKRDPNFIGIEGGFGFRPAKKKKR